MNISELRQACDLFIEIRSGSKEMTLEDYQTLRQLADELLFIAHPLPFHALGAAHMAKFMGLIEEI